MAPGPQFFGPSFSASPFLMMARHLPNGCIKIFPPSGTMYFADPGAMLIDHKAAHLMQLVQEIERGTLAFTHRSVLIKDQELAADIFEVELLDEDYLEPDIVEFESPDGESEF